MMKRYKIQFGTGDLGFGTRVWRLRTPKSAFFEKIRNPQSAIRNGFTLVELMISVVVMILMMLAFGMIVTEAQKVVNVTQAQTRGNGTADSIARVIRNGLSKITKNGFLCITQATNYSSNARLIFTTAGITRSRLVNNMGTGGISTYGTIDTDKGYLFHQGWVLTQTLPFERDIWMSDLAEIQKMRRYQINELIGNYSSNGPEKSPNQTLLYLASPTVVDFVVPPNRISDIENLWKLLSDNVTRLGIMWTDGTVDPTSGELNWYGVNRDYVNATGNIINTPKETAPETGIGDLDDWATDAGTTPDDQDNFLAGTDGYKEFRTQSNDGPSYRVLWTHHDQDCWPKAIKVKFKIVDEDLQKATGDDSTIYEVVVPID